MKSFADRCCLAAQHAEQFDGEAWWRIFLPLAKPALSAVAIVTFLASWNLYLEPTVDAYGGEMWNTQLAAATMTVVPVLVVLVVAQLQFVEGLAHSGLKG